jgi:methionyl-tRNA formyltransferase
VRLVFCGTPQFAVPSLQAVLRAGHEVALVLAQPDRPSGRGMETAEPAVKRAAVELGLLVAQPEKIRNNDALRAQLEALGPDAIIVVAYGRLIPAWMLALPRYGNINVHGSLLPKYRGAAPVQWAIANGEAETGVTTMLLDEGLDTGAILLQRKMAIGENVTAGELFPVVAELGAEALVDTLRGIESGAIKPQPQDGSLATHAPILTREDGRIDWGRSARDIYNRWRGFQPWPGAFTTFRGKRLTIEAMAIRDSARAADEPGMVHVDGERMSVACGERTAVELLEVKPEGKRAMSAGEFLRGAKPAGTERLG